MDRPGTLAPPASRVRPSAHAPPASPHRGRRRGRVARRRRSECRRRSVTQNAASFSRRVFRNILYPSNALTTPTVRGLPRDYHPPPPPSLQRSNRSTNAFTNPPPARASPTGSIFRARLNTLCVHATPRRSPRAAVANATFAGGRTRSPHPQNAQSAAIASAPIPATRRAVRASCLDAPRPSMNARVDRRKRLESIEGNRTIRLRILRRMLRRSGNRATNANDPSIRSPPSPGRLGPARRRRHPRSYAL